jgi:hypothetical protein
MVSPFLQFSNKYSITNIGFITENWNISDRKFRVFCGVTVSFGDQLPTFLSTRKASCIYSSPFPLSKTWQALGPNQRPFKWILGFFSGIRRLERGVDHSSPSSAEKNGDLRFPYTSSWRKQRQVYLYLFNSTLQNRAWATKSVVKQSKNK